MKSSHSWMRLIGALFLVAALGCAEEPEVETTTRTGMETTETTEEEVPGLPDGSEPVQVVLTNFSMDMPETLPEGTTIFTVRNESDTEHNFEIEGQGIEREFEKNLLGGEVKTMEVDLFPGEYRVYCPVEDHASQGMERTLTVTEGEPTTAEEMPEETPTDTTEDEYGGE